MLMTKRTGYHYDVRPRPPDRPASPPVGLAARCKHGEQMLNECVSCELEEVRRRLDEIERVSGMGQWVTVAQEVDLANMCPDCRVPPPGPLWPTPHRLGCQYLEKA